MKAPSWALEDTFIGPRRYLRRLLRLSSFFRVIFHVLVVPLVVAARHVVQPILILEVPLHGLLDALLLVIDVKIEHDVLQARVLQVFLAEYRLLHRDAPVNAQGLVLDADASISVGMI